MDESKQKCERCGRLVDLWDMSEQGYICWDCQEEIDHTDIVMVDREE